jgi:type 1 glutamine amidotransferase
MLRKILRVLLWLLLASVIFVAVQAFRNRDLIQRVFLGGLKVYETVPPQIPADLPRPAILVFSKTNGFRHEEAIPAANTLFTNFAKAKGWGYFQTENGATFRPDILAKFDAVVFNNVSGDVFTADQRSAFKQFVENGGGFVGIHAAGDNSHEGWPWYHNEMIGAKFTMHTMSPQFQEALAIVEDSKHPSTLGLPASWKRTEEWYSFEKSPRSRPGFSVLVSVDEKTYNPIGMFGQDIRMGDHPMVWWRCVGPKKQRQGRVLYNAFGHQAAAYSEPENKRLLEQAVTWAARREGTECGTAPAAASK